MKQIIFFAIICFTVQSYGQCPMNSLVFNFPTTVNGVTVNESNTEATHYWSSPNDTMTWCGVLCGTFQVGYNGYYSSPFIQTLTFSSPVNNIVYIVNASDSSSGGNETFSFTVNSGVLSSTQQNNIGSCLYTQQGNLFSANQLDVPNSHGNAAYITLSSTIPYDTIKVYGTGGLGGSLMSLCANSIGTTSGITETTINNTINIYPNPTSDQFFIKANTTDKLNLDLYDVNGRHVLGKIVNDKTIIDATILNAGIYTLTIKTADSVINKKLVVVH